MDPIIPLTIGAAVGAWALLRVVGAERERLVREQEAKAPVLGPAQPAPAAQAPANQVVR
ncbi:MAG TPA: hypothetical protein VG269_18100 [Tepidisphaeraceae bacterium]|nr:hypothetical protein [Tepidisphaeraceae bacterium]